MAMNEPAKTFKVLSALLAYPTEELQTAVPQLKAALVKEGLLPQKVLSSLDKLLGEIERRDLYDLQERYVLLFDRTRSLSLHLFEHVHGESRDRGQAMIDLAELYHHHGLAIEARELPDYLPLFLEFLSILPGDNARDFLGQPIHIIAVLKQRLRKRQSPYATIFLALEELSREKPKAGEVEALFEEPEDDPDDLQALDKTWAEEAVTFGPGEGGCPKVSGMLERIGAAIPSAPTPRAD